MTAPVPSRTALSSAELIRAEEPVLAHNYHPLPVVVARAEGTWVEDVEGRRYLDMLAGYSALNFGHRHPALIEAAHRQLDRLTLTSRAFHNDRLAEFAERPGRADRPGHGAADEHRRGGGGERHQGGPQVGVRGQGRPGRPGDDRGGGGQLPRPYDDDRRLLHGRDGPGGLRPLHAGLPDRAVQRPRRAGGGGRRDDGRGADRAHPGRGGRRHPGRRLSDRRPRADPARTGCLFIADEIQSGSRPHRHAPSRSSTRRSCRTCCCSARRWAAASSRSPRWSPAVRCSACCARASTARPSAATRWRRRSARRWSSCWRPASSSAARPSWARVLRDGLAGAGRQGRRRLPRPRPVGGRRHRPGPRHRPRDQRSC